MNFSLHTVFGLSVLSALAGCSTVSDGSLLRWDARLQNVVPRSAIPAGTDSRCAPPLSTPVIGPEPLVGIVRLRVGRSPYDMAFWLPEGFDAQPGASVTVDSRRCKLWQAHSTK